LAMFMEHVIPAFFNDDKDGILARQNDWKRKLTARFSYLQDFVDGNRFWIRVSGHFQILFSTDKIKLKTCNVTLQGFNLWLN
jgi:hypothetical protein